MKLNELKEKDRAIVSDISGDHRYITRVSRMMKLSDADRIDLE